MELSGALDVFLDLGTENTSKGPHKSNGSGNPVFWVSPKIRTPILQYIQVDGVNFKEQLSAVSVSAAVSR